MILRHPADIGYLHVIDYYLSMAVRQIKPANRARYGFLTPKVDDYDIQTERREGWTYADPV